MKVVRYEGIRDTDDSNRNTVLNDERENGEDFSLIITPYFLTVSTFFVQLQPKYVGNHEEQTDKPNQHNDDPSVESGRLLSIRMQYGQVAGEWQHHQR